MNNHITKSARVKETRNLAFTIVFFLLICSESSCKKLVDVSAPVTSLTQGNIYATDATASSVLTGIYEQLTVQGSSNQLPAISLLGALSADELKLYYLQNTTYLAYY